MMHLRSHLLGTFFSDSLLELPLGVDTAPGISHKEQMAQSN